MFQDYYVISKLIIVCVKSERTEIWLCINVSRIISSGLNIFSDYILIIISISVVITQLIDLILH